LGKATLGKVPSGPKEQKRRADIQKIILIMLYRENQGGNYFGHAHREHGRADLEHGACQGRALVVLNNWTTKVSQPLD